MRKELIGFDIGGTKCAVVLGYSDHFGATILGRREVSTREADSPEQMVDILCELAKEMVQTHGLHPEAVGISCGGPLDSKSGIILSPPNLPGWDRIPITNWIKEKMGIPAYLQNDANAGALAEWRYGAGRGCDNIIFITFGTGCGAGLILNGKLYAGTNDMAGECGHVRLSDYGPVGYGKAGSMEGFCSGSGIAQLAVLFIREAVQLGVSTPICEAYSAGEEITAKLVAAAARSDDPVAIKVFQSAGEQLGRALAILVDILNPQRIVIGSVFTRCYDLLWPAALPYLKREALERSCHVCEVVPAELSEAIGDYAALCVADYGSSTN